MSEFTFECIHRNTEVSWKDEDGKAPIDECITLECEHVTLDALYAVFENFLRACGFGIEQDFEKECPRCGRGEEEAPIEEVDTAEHEVEADGFVTEYPRFEKVSPMYKPSNWTYANGKHTRRGCYNG